MASGQMAACETTGIKKASRNFIASLILRRAMALFVFLAAAARAWVVAADLLAGLHRPGAGAVVAAELQLRQFPFLLALDVASEVLHGVLGGLARLLRGVGTRLVSVPVAGFFFVFV